MVAAEQSFLTVTGAGPRQRKNVKAVSKAPSVQKREPRSRHARKDRRRKPFKGEEDGTYYRRAKSRRKRKMRFMFDGGHRADPVRIIEKKKRGKRER